MNEIPTKLTTVEALVEQLNANGKNSYLKVMKQALELPQEAFEKYLSWRDDRYTRNCIARTEDYELLLICWEKGQASPIHDFNAQEAWIHPVSGKITEERFRWSPEDPSRLEKVSSLLLTPNEFSFMSGSENCHRFINANEDSSGRTITLNLYSKPVEEWTVFDEETGEAWKEKVTYDTFNGEPV